MISILNLVIGFLFLLYFTYNDLKYGEIENRQIIIFFFITLLLTILYGQLIKIIILSFIVFIPLYFLWKRGALGGADIKIIPLIIPYILMDGQNIYSNLWFFFIIFGITGGVYGLISKWTNKNKKEVPFLPAIVLSYLFYFIFQTIK